jgi:hypothetical protein
MDARLAGRIKGYSRRVVLLHFLQWTSELKGCKAVNGCQPGAKRDPQQQQWQAALVIAKPSLRVSVVAVRSDVLCHLLRCFC